MKRRCALTIAGSDSGGGAGIQADLRAFTHFGVHGCTAITALTAQNPFGVSAIQTTTPQLISEQLSQVSAAFELAAIKTGMLVNVEIIERVIAWLKETELKCPLIIDPVMVATSGARLIDAEASEALLQLTQHATLITPNLPEAETLLGDELHTETDYLKALPTLKRITGTKAILLKGGHNLQAMATDWFCDETGQCFKLSMRPIENPLTTHGTGCTLSAAIAANLALGKPLLEAILIAKSYLTGALAGCTTVGKASVFALPVSSHSIEEIDVSLL